MPTGTAICSIPEPVFQVSILVLLDDAYRRNIRCINRELKIQFQSLFFWMMPTGLLSFCHQGMSIRVSILVLLDDAYRPEICQLRKWIVLRFQSLFFWMMPTGLKSEGKTPNYTPGFNPCSSG